MTGWKVLTAAALVSHFLHICSAKVLECTVRQDGQQTTYSLSPVIHASTSYWFSWCNATNYVLANEGGHIDLVIACNLSTLVTSRCIDGIHFTGHNDSGDFWANCTMKCTSDQPQVPVNSDQPQVPDHGSWMIPMIVTVIVVLAILCFLCCKYKEKICRKCCCSQVGGFYAVVKMNTGQEAVDVEAGNK